MNELTKTVIELQKVEKGSHEWDTMYTYVYECLQGTINQMVSNFELALRGDIQEGHSIAMLQLIKCINTFKYEGYEFRTFYRKSLRNKLVDLTRTLMAKKMRHNTSYSVSLSTDVTDESGFSYPIMDRLQDISLRTYNRYNIEEAPSLSQLLDAFSEVDREKADILEILIKYSAEGNSKRDVTTALANYYGSNEYTGLIQRRVSRAREAFKKFACENGYEKF